MNRLLLAASILLVLTGAIACSSDGGSGSNGDEPSEYATARDALARDLESIRDNLGDVPAGIERDILASCEGLSSYVSASELEPICSDIDGAIESNDPELLDSVLARLRTLEP